MTVESKNYYTYVYAYIFLYITAINEGKGYELEKRQRGVYVRVWREENYAISI